MSDLKIDARLKEINIKIRAMEGEQTRRRLEAANGLNDELHKVDDKFHEEMKALKEKYMDERQSIEDRYFAERKAIDKEYEDKRLDLIDSIKEVIGDISEVVGIEPSKSVTPVSHFESVNNEYTSIFDNNEDLLNDDIEVPAPSIQTPLTKIEDIEESLEEVSNGFSPVEPAIEDINMPAIDNFPLNTEVTEVSNNIIETPLQEVTTFEPIINEPTIDEPVVNVPIQPEVVVTSEIVPTSVEVQTLEEVPLTPVVEQPVMVNMPAAPEVEMISQVVTEVPTTQVLNQVSYEQPVQEVNVTNQSVPETIANEQPVAVDVNASIDNILGDINISN